MGTQVEQAAADFVPSDGHQRALTDTPEVIAIPESWRGQFVWFHNSDEEEEAFLNFAAEHTVTVDETTVSARDRPPSFVLAANPSAPKAIVPAGQGISFRLDATWQFFAHKSAGTGLLRFGKGQGSFGREV
jgi:hypothetical protein